MKKIAAILLILIFLFNLFGYRLLLNYVQQQSDLTQETSFDKNDLDETQLISIKVPLSLPYQNNQANFERVDGELKLNGKLYKYVKRKISDGQLILLCLPDHRKMQLQSAKDEFFKYSNDLVQNNSSKKSDSSKSGSFKNPVTEYDNYAGCFSISNITTRLVHARSIQTYRIPVAPHSSPDRPPQVMTL